MCKFMELFVTLVVFIVFCAIGVMAISLIFFAVKFIVENLCETIYTVKEFISNIKE